MVVLAGLRAWNRWWGGWGLEPQPADYEKHGPALRVRYLHGYHRAVPPMTLIAPFARVVRSTNRSTPNHGDHRTPATERCRRQLAHQQSGVIPARVPRAEHPRPRTRGRPAPAPPAPGNHRPPGDTGMHARLCYCTTRTRKRQDTVQALWRGQLSTLPASPPSPPPSSPTPATRYATWQRPWQPWTRPRSESSPPIPPSRSGQAAPANLPTTSYACSTLTSIQRSAVLWR